MSTITMTGFALPALPYTLEALEPQISRETMEYHYGKHLQTYITNLNNLIKETEFEGAPLEEIVRKSQGPLFNNAAQAWNHEFFFKSFSPNSKSMPTDALAQAIDRDFGSFVAFKEQYSKTALSLFGSGWAWLVRDNAGKLSITSESNAGNPMTKGLTPLLTFDVWEHAYYIDYRNRRADYISAIWGRIDWKVMEDRYGK